MYSFCPSQSLVRRRKIIYISRFIFSITCNGSTTTLAKFISLIWSCLKTKGSLLCFIWMFLSYVAVLSFPNLFFSSFSCSSTIYFYTVAKESSKVSLRCLKNIFLLSCWQKYSWKCSLTSYLHPCNKVIQRMIASSLIPLEIEPLDIKSQITLIIPLSHNSICLLFMLSL